MPARVRRRERVARAARRSRAPPPAASGPALLHVRREVLALEELHHEVREPARRVDAGRLHLDHVLALDARADARLLLEAPPRAPGSRRAAGASA